MKSNFITAAVVAVAALTSVAASAEGYNQYLFDQMKAPVTKTRAEVKAEVLQERQNSASTVNGYVQPAEQGNKAAAKNVSLESSAALRAVQTN